MRAFFSFLLIFLHSIFSNQCSSTTYIYPLLSRYFRSFWLCCDRSIDLLRLRLSSRLKMTRTVTQCSIPDHLRGFGFKNDHRIILVGLLQGRTCLDYWVSFLIRFRFFELGLWGFRRFVLFLPRSVSPLRFCFFCFLFPVLRVLWILWIRSVSRFRDLVSILGLWVLILRLIWAKWKESIPLCRGDVDSAWSKPGIDVEIGLYRQRLAWVSPPALSKPSPFFFAFSCLPWLLRMQANGPTLLSL